MNERTYCRTAGVILGLIALMHLCRALMGVHAHLGAWIVPVRLSWVGLLVVGGLAIVGGKAGRAPARTAMEPPQDADKIAIPHAQNVRGP